MYAEVVVNRPIVKRTRRDFVDTPEDDDIPPPELAAPLKEALGQ